MNGLDKIIAEIAQDAKSAAEQKRGEAQAVAERALERAREEAKAIEADAAQRAELEYKRIVARAHSTGEIAKKGVLLREKQKIIDDILPRQERCFLCAHAGDAVGVLLHTITPSQTGSP